MAQNKAYISDHVREILRDKDARKELYKIVNEGSKGNIKIGDKIFPVTSTGGTSNLRISRKAR